MKKNIRMTAMLLAIVAVIATGCKNNSGKAGDNAENKVENTEENTTQDQNKPLEGVENGHEWVDLGLPSGTLWATCNVGANTSEEYGGFFAWAETEEQAEDGYLWSTYKYYEDNDVTKYFDNDGLKELEAEDDAATAIWGGNWRTPTAEEMRELIDKCEYKYTTQNGVDGLLFTSANGNSIFMPGAGSCSDGGCDKGTGIGFYWSSSLGSEYSDYAWFLLFDSEEVSMSTLYGRSCGMPVRPVLSRE